MCHNSTRADFGGSWGVTAQVRGGAGLVTNLPRHSGGCASLVTVVTKGASRTDVDLALASLAALGSQLDGFVEWQRFNVHTLVADLRANGATWREIGAAAGISHVAAMKRWKGAPVPPETPSTDYSDPEDR